MTEQLKTYGRQKKLKKLFLEQLARTPIVSIVAEKTGVPRSTYYRWLKEDQDFGLLAQEVYIEGVSGLNDMASSQLMKLIKEGDRHAIMFWLRCRDPEFGGTITKMKKPEGMASLSKEKRKALEQLFQYQKSVHDERYGNNNQVDENTSSENPISGENTQDIRGIEE